MTAPPSSKQCAHVPLFSAGAGQIAREVTPCLRCEIERLQLGLRRIGELSLSFKTVVQRLLAGESIDQISSAPTPVETTGVTNEQAFIAAAVKALRGHRWCGDQYPEDGWPDVNTALALYAKLGRSPEKEPPPVHGNDGAPCSCKGHPFNCYGHPTKCGCSAVEPTYNPETVAAIKAAQASGGKAVCCQQFPDCECEPEKASDE